MSGKTCGMQTDRYARDARFLPFEEGGVSPRMENGGGSGTPSVPSIPMRPPLLACPPRPGCGCQPPTRPECGFVPEEHGSAFGRTRGQRARCGGNSGNSCDGGNGGTEGLMRELQAVEFALDEVVLYLDAYPCDQAALDFYHHLLERRAPLLEQYQAEIGPLTPVGNTSRTSWDWIGKPFPWELDANV